VASALVIIKLLVRGAAALDDDVLEAYIALAEEEVCDDAFPATVRPKAVALLAGHMLQRISDSGGGGGGGAGGVTSVKDGDLSRGYGAPATSTADSGYATTQAGMDYLRLIRSNIAAVYTTTLADPCGRLGFP